MFLSWIFLQKIILFVGSPSKRTAYYLGMRALYSNKTPDYGLNQGFKNANENICCIFGQSG